MNAIVPPQKPRLSRAEVERIVRDVNGLTEKCVLLGIRGYYSNTFAPAGNNIAVYDDAIFLLTPTAFSAFNANTDPSSRKPEIAQLCPGVHRYKKGKHGISRGPGYPALRPATPNEGLPVTRAGKEGVHQGIAINIHKGSYTKTSSAGCQTIYPDQWKEFISLVYAQMEWYDQDTIPYLLVTQESLS